MIMPYSLGKLSLVHKSFFGSYFSVIYIYAFWVHLSQELLALFVGIAKTAHLSNWRTSRHLPRLRGKKVTSEIKKEKTGFRLVSWHQQSVQECFESVENTEKVC